MPAEYCQWSDNSRILPMQNGSMLPKCNVTAFVRILQLNIIYCCQLEPTSLVLSSRPLPSSAKCQLMRHSAEPSGTARLLDILPGLIWEFDDDFPYNNKCFAISRNGTYMAKLIWPRTRQTTLQAHKRMYDNFIEYQTVSVQPIHSSSLPQTTISAAFWKCTTYSLYVIEYLCFCKVSY